MSRLMSESQPSAGRFLGIDPGSRRIGLALSDPSNTIAQPLPGYLPANARSAGAISGLITEYSVGAVVIGLPITAGGQETESATMARRLGEKIASLSRVDVIYFDERFSTMQAGRTAQSLNLSRGKTRQSIDGLAAAAILQSFLDSRLK